MLALNLRTVKEVRLKKNSHNKSSKNELFTDAPCGMSCRICMNTLQWLQYLTPKQVDSHFIEVLGKLS